MHPFAGAAGASMQDVGCRGNMEPSDVTLTLRGGELSVEFLGHCQPVGNWMMFPRASAVKIFGSSESPGRAQLEFSCDVIRLVLGNASASLMRSDGVSGRDDLTATPSALALRVASIFRAAVSASAASSPTHPKRR